MTKREREVAHEADVREASVRLARTDRALRRTAAPLKRQTRVRLTWPGPSTRWTAASEIAAIYDKPDDRPQRNTRRQRMTTEEWEELASQYE